MATHSSILAWRIPWTEKPGGLQSIGSQRVGHDWSDLMQHLGYLKLYFFREKRACVSWASMLLAVNANSMALLMVGSCVLTVGVSVLAVTLSFGFTRCYHGEKLRKGYVGSLCIISYNYMWMYNYLKIKNSIFKKPLKGTTLLFLRYIKGQKSPLLLWRWFWK